MTKELKNPDVILLNLKVFSQSIIEKEELSLPVKIELLDLGMNLIFETDAEKTGEGTYVFSTVRYGLNTAHPAPFRVRFTATGGRQFSRDFPS